MDDGKVRFSMKRKGQYTTHVFSCEFCEIFKNIFFAEHVWVTVSQYRRLIILSYPTVRRKMFAFKNTRALFSFSSLLMEILILFI